jgi:hypothetical protein
MGGFWRGDTPGPVGPRYVSAVSALLALTFHFRGQIYPHKLPFTLVIFPRAVAGN